MKLKSQVGLLAVFTLLGLPAFAQVYDVSKFIGSSYISNSSQDFVFVKRLKFEKDDTGRLLLRATLSGFPTDVPLGSAPAESYTSRNAAVYRSYLVNFSEGKLKVLMIVNTSANSPQNLSVTSYMKYTDGSRPDVCFDTQLQKESDTGK